MSDSTDNPNPQDRIQELEAEIEQLKQTNKEKSEFLSMVAHQLRTPLSGIKWTLKMLLDDDDVHCFSQEQRDFIEKGLDSSDRMVRLLREIMIADQKGAWKFSYRLKPLNLAHLIEQMIDEFREEARGSKVHLTFKSDQSARDLLARADRDKVILVLENLLENAIKYNEPYGTVEVGLSRYTTEKDGSTREFLKTSIHNTGLSIPLDEQSKLFSKFFRASNARKKIQTGTGLGLFTSKQVIEQQGGGIWCSSKPEDGTTFYFTLPIVQTKVGSLSTSHHLKPAIEYET